MGVMQPSWDDSTIGELGLPLACSRFIRPERPLCLLVLSDIRFLRDGLAEVLGRDPTFRIVGTAANPAEALVAAREGSPDVILIDTTLPGGLAATRQFCEILPQVRLIALAVTETDAEVIAWAKAGVHGYVPRSAALGDLVGLLIEIMHGEQVCSTRVAAGLLRWIAKEARDQGSRPSAASPSPTLTTREEQVARLIEAGLSNKEIARRLNIGLATTKSHVHNVLGKLDLTRRSQITVWIRQQQHGHAVPWKQEPRSAE
jgi:two-component system, NarL family, nitrate/nitrite response regulator NarL